MRNPQVMIKVLIVTSIVMFLSIFIGSYKILGVTLSLWTLNIAWIMYLLMGDLSIKDILSTSEKRIQEAKENGHHFEAEVRTIALPLCVVGVIVLIINLVWLFFM